MATVGYTLFETAIGTCAVAWGERGIVAVELPRSQAETTRARLQRRFPGARESLPPGEISLAIGAMQRLLSGEPESLEGVTLDFAGASELHRRVWEIARTIPPGMTATYGEIAQRLGDRLLAQEVGKALGANPFPIIVPCHRVLAAGGKIGGFSAPGGVATKRRMLAIESVLAKGEATLFDR